MKIILVQICLLFLSISSVFGVNKEAFYKAFSSSSVEDINTCIQGLQKEKKSSKANAYIGALQMKRASLLSSPIDKLKSFKSGALMLEQEIKDDKSNVEYRFLRFAIQEKAPLILGYNKNIQEDKGKIIQGFPELDSFIQEQIRQYAKDSKNLKLNELNKK